MSELARAQAEKPGGLEDRVLKQLARELLLAQASDWAFLMKTGTAKEYATKRTMDHLVRFNRLRDQVVPGNVDQQFLHDCEWRDGDTAIFCFHQHVPAPRRDPDRFCQWNYQWYRLGPRSERLALERPGHPGRLRCHQRR